MSCFTKARDLVETGVSLLGNYELPGSSLISDRLVSKGAQNYLNTPYGQIAQLGTGFAGGGGFGSDLQSVGGALEQSTLSNLGSQISNGLSNFSDSSGLSQLFGGTAAPSSDLTSVYDAINTTAPNLDATAGATSPVDFAPGGASSSYSAGASAPGGAGVGGGTLTGFGGDSSGIGDVSTLGSSQGGAPNLFGSTGDTPNPFSSPIQSISGDGAPVSLLSDPQFSQPNVFGNVPTSGASYTPNNPFEVSNNNIFGSPSTQLSGSSSMAPTGLSSLFGGNTNMANGLLKAGAGYLLNNNNASGERAISDAAIQAQQGFAPYQQAGAGAENTLANLYGNNGQDAQNAAYGNFQTSPGYKFALDQGLNAINADAAAKGQTLSGNTMEGINNYAQGTAAQQFNNYINQLQNMASGGLSAAGGSGTAGLTGAGARAQIGQNNANAQNTAVGTGLSALFPGGGIDFSKLFSGNSNNNNGLLSLFG